MVFAMGLHQEPSGIIPIAQIFWSAKFLQCIARALWPPHCYTTVGYNLLVIGTMRIQEVTPLHDIRIVNKYGLVRMAAHGNERGVVSGNSTLTLTPLSRMETRCCCHNQRH